ncbi:MAG: hypothetical protein RR846_06220 [Oscillospiraceae bacterium]
MRDGNRRGNHKADGGGRVGRGMRRWTWRRGTWDVGRGTWDVGRGDGGRADVGIRPYNGGRTWVRLAVT